MNTKTTKTNSTAKATAAHSTLASRPARIYHALPLPAQKKTSNRSLVAHGFGSSYASDSVTLVTQLASTAAWAAAAYMGFQLVLQKAAAADRSGQKECERCQGTGYVDCFCSRWSDAGRDQSGCGSCGGTKKMRCNACGGGGTAVPIEARIYIQPEKDYYK